MTSAVRPATPATPFDDLDDFLALRRVSGLAVARDGSRIVTTVTHLNDNRTEFVGALWELDPAGVAPARRLTHGVKGESAPEFTAGGDLLFLAARPTGGDDKPAKSLWRLPTVGGEAVEEMTLPGGVDAVTCAQLAQPADTIVVGSSMMPSASNLDDDKRLRAARTGNAVSAVLHAGYPIRHWDHDLGPEQPHLFDGSSGDGPRDLTPQPGAGLRDAQYDLSADGTAIVTTWQVLAPRAAKRGALVRIDVGTGQRHTLVDDPDADLGLPAISPDGQSVAFTRETLSTPHSARRINAVLDPLR